MNIVLTVDEALLYTGWTSDADGNDDLGLCEIMGWDMREADGSNPAEFDAQLIVFSEETARRLGILTPHSEFWTKRYIRRCAQGHELAEAQYHSSTLSGNMQRWSLHLHEDIESHIPDSGQLNTVDSQETNRNINKASNNSSKFNGYNISIEDIEGSYKLWTTAKTIADVLHNIGDTIAGKIITGIEHIPSAHITENERRANFERDCGEDYGGCPECCGFNTYLHACAGKAEVFIAACDIHGTYSIAQTRKYRGDEIDSELLCITWNDINKTMTYIDPHKNDIDLDDKDIPFQKDMVNFTNDFG